MKKTIFLFSCLLAFLLSFPWVDNIAQSKQTRLQVSGQVVDYNNEPLTGVSVQLKGTGVGTLTDIDGKYKIEVPENNSTLVFSYISFKTLEKAVKGNILHVVLEEDIKELDDVVVVGYGVQKKRDLSGAIASIETKDIEAQSPISVFDALQGQVAGVEVVSGSGAPGEESIVRVRGIATFESGANPLYVVDGVVYDNIDDINPDDIASIEVLKDAASAAIYGSRSANGVFLISTKQGDSKTNLKVGYLRSYSNLIRKMPKANAAERKYYDAVRRDVSSKRNPTTYGYTIADSLAYFRNQDQDLQDLVFQSAIRDEITLSSSGSTNKFKYYLSAGYLNDQGIIVNSGYNRLTTRVNADFSPTDKLTISTKMYFSYSDKDGIDENGVLNQLLERIPYWAIFNPDGSYVQNINNRRNPYAVAMEDIDTEQNYKATLYENLSYKINKYFSLNLNLQANYSNRRDQFYRPSPQLHSSERTTGTDKSRVNWDWANENYLTYKQTFKKHHTVDAMFGMSFSSWHSERLEFKGLDYTSDELWTLNAASDFDVKGTYTRVLERSMASFFGRAGYNYKSKYIVNANLRYDGSSRFGPNNSWGAFPSGSVAWRLSDESFNRWMKPLVSDAKLRVSYGITGNESFGEYDAWSLYSPDFVYEDEGVNVAGIGPSNLGFEGLSWEETAQFNIGLDLRLFKNRVSIIADYYKKNTDRLLAKVELPKETGYSTIRKNVGEMSNEGFEFAINWEAIRNKKLKWNLNFNVATNVAKIIKIADGIPFYRGTSEAIYVQEGGRLGDFYGYKYLGIFPYDESNAFTENWQQLTPNFGDDGTFSHYTLNGETYSGVINQKRASSKIKPDEADSDILKGGDVNIQDMNGDGVIDILDKTYIGNAQPDFFGGVSSTLTWKDFSLYVSLYYSIGGKVYNHTEAKRNQFRQDGATPSPHAIQHMWTKPGDNALYPAPIIFEHNMLAPSDFYMEDGSYIKLKNVKLTYNLPKKWASKAFMKSASLYLYGKNLLTFTDYTGYDAEFGDNSDPLTMGIDSNRYPRKRELGFGLNIGF